MENHFFVYGHVLGFTEDLSVCVRFIAGSKTTLTWNENLPAKRRHFIAILYIALWLIMDVSITDLPTVKNPCRALEGLAQGIACTENDSLLKRYKSPCDPWWAGRVIVIRRINWYTCRFFMQDGSSVSLFRFAFFFFASYAYRLEPDYDNSKAILIVNSSQ